MWVDTNIRPDDKNACVFTSEGERLTFRKVKMDGMGLQVLVCIHENHNEPSAAFHMDGQHVVATDAVATWASGDNPWTCEFGQPFAEEICVMELADKEP